MRMTAQTSTLSRKVVLRTSDKDPKADLVLTTTTAVKTTATRMQHQQPHRRQQQLLASSNKAATTTHVVFTACLETRPPAASATAPSTLPSSRSNSRETTRGVDVSECGDPHPTPSSQRPPIRHRHCNKTKVASRRRRRALDHSPNIGTTHNRTNFSTASSGQRFQDILLWDSRNDRVIG